MPTMSSTSTPSPGSEFTKGALKANTPPSAPPASTRRPPAVDTMPVMSSTSTPSPGSEP